MEESSVNDKTVGDGDEGVQLKLENKRLRDEFDVQRAKFKELYFQKEDELSKKKSENENLSKNLLKMQSELDETKSQLLAASMQLESNVADEKRKAAEEIATLQQLVQETVEESSSSKYRYDSEVKKLLTYIQQLQNEMTELKNEKQNSPHHTSQEQSSLAPGVVISGLTKKIVKKFSADTFASQDDEHREDAELLRSLVGPLEEEIKALKDKLRAADEQIQRCSQCSQEQELQHSSHQQNNQRLSLQSTSTNTSFESKTPMNCDMCRNYEAQLVGEQKLVSELQTKITNAEKLVERHKEDLLKEIGFRKDMEEKWNEKKEEHKKQVEELTLQMSRCEHDLKEVQSDCRDAESCMEQMEGRLREERDRVQQELSRLQQENHDLIGKYTVHYKQLESESIYLPDTVPELQEQMLQLREDLIVSKVAKERAEELTQSYQCELDQVREEVEMLSTNTKQLMEEKEIWQRDKSTREHIEKDLAAVNKTKRVLEEKNAELKLQVASLQQELATGETVQKDFVKLSQNLQVQLEKIRNADTQVRWQHEEDVDSCNGCRGQFASARYKEHCRHCGQIYCPVCLNHVVHSGPAQRPSKVCSVCHTLLVKSSAPYFSKEAPHSPD